MKQLISVYDGRSKPTDVLEQALTTCACSVYSVATRCVQVCTIFKVPIALVSLVEKERQWFKSVVGLQASHNNVQLAGVCPHTVVTNCPSCCTAWTSYCARSQQVAARHGFLSISTLAIAGDRDVPSHLLLRMDAHSCEPRGPGGGGCYSGPQVCSS